MDDKTNLYVFEKKEVALIFIFMILMAITAFILGVKVGKDYSFSDAGFTEKDRERIDLLSNEEEKVNETVREKTETVENDTAVDMKSMHENLEKKIEEELSKDDEERTNESGSDPIKSENYEDAEQTRGEKSEGPSGLESGRDESLGSIGESGQERAQDVGSDPYRGKFTIQLGSHRSLNDAKEFAEGFKIRGYNPIVNEVELPGRGTWYRVSLGVFEDVTQAKEYILKEKSLFEGQDYVIARFD